MFMTVRTKESVLEDVKQKALREVRKVGESGLMRLYQIYPWKVAIRRDYIDCAVCYSIFEVDDFPLSNKRMPKSKSVTHTFRFDKFPPSWRNEINAVYTKTFEEGIGYKFAV